MDLKSGPDTDDFRYFDPKLLRGTSPEFGANRTQTPFNDAIVFVVGGGKNFPRVKFCFKRGNQLNSDDFFPYRKLYWISEFGRMYANKIDSKKCRLWLHRINERATICSATRIAWRRNQLSRWIKWSRLDAKKHNGISWKFRLGRWRYHSQ